MHRAQSAIVREPLQEARAQRDAGHERHRERDGRGRAGATPDDPQDRVAFHVVPSLPRALHWLDRKTRRGPCDEAADDIGRLLETELVKPDRGEAGGIALVTDEDEPVFASGECRALMA